MFPIETPSIQIPLPLIINLSKARKREESLCISDVTSIITHQIRNCENFNVPTLLKEHTWSSVS